MQNRNILKFFTVYRTYIRNLELYILWHTITVFQYIMLNYINQYRRHVHFYSFQTLRFQNIINLLVTETLENATFYSVTNYKVLNFAALFM